MAWRLQICGPRSAFGEEIALNGQHQPPGGSKGAADPKKLDEFAPRHTYSVRMNAASELFLIPRQVLLDFFSGGARRRQDMKKELFDKLSALAAGRESWITPMVPHHPAHCHCPPCRPACFEEEMIQIYVSVCV